MISGRTAALQLVYTQDGRGQLRETHELGLLVTGDTIMIDSDRLIGTPEPPILIDSGSC